MSDDYQYKCAHCGREKGYHKAETFNCPMGRGSFTHYMRDSFFSPDPKKPVKRPAVRI